VLPLHHSRIFFPSFSLDLTPSYASIVSCLQAGIAFTFHALTISLSSMLVNPVPASRNLATFFRLLMMTRIAEKLTLL
jgi:hypothetical protein